MLIWRRGVSLSLLLSLLHVNCASVPTHEEYIVYSELENQLFSAEDSPFNVYLLAEVFYPKVGPAPICVPIKYTLICPNATAIDNCTSDPIQCTELPSTSFNASFLWSEYDLGTPIGPILLSYAWSGIALRGFDWEDSCSFQKGIDFVVDIGNISCHSGEVIKDALKALTAVVGNAIFTHTHAHTAQFSTPENNFPRAFLNLEIHIIIHARPHDLQMKMVYAVLTECTLLSVQVKSYAKNQGKEGSLGSSDTKGYALKWNEEDRKAKVFHASHSVLVSMLVVLNVFVFLIVTAMVTFTYSAVYESILLKRNPNYPLFWSFVILSFVWNVGPSWLVLSKQSTQVYYSLAVMVPLECLVAVLVKKRSDFPVPLLSPRGCQKHDGYYFSFERSIVFGCPYCLVSHAVQTLAMWTVLVFLTFLAYYLASIIVAFYLYPTQVLVKVLFLKAVAVCAVLNVALLFSNSKFECGCSWNSFKRDLVYVVRVIAIAMFLPILAFLAFVIGGIIFTDTGAVSWLQSVLTLLPSVVLVFAAWFTKGTLFPAGSTEADIGSNIINDLESGGAGSHTNSAAKTTTSKTSSPTRAKSGELSYYNSLDRHAHPQTDNRLGEGEITDESKPLLH